MIRRVWTDARDKVEAEGACRVRALGGCEGPLETAHTVARIWDREVAPGVLYVDPEDCVPCCSRHHRLYDAGRLDLLPWLTYREQAAAVRHIGLERARRRLAPSVARAVEGLVEAAGEAAELGGAA